MPAVLILAGGRATRMGGSDKALRLVAGRTLLEHVLDRLAGQAAPILLNANGDPGRFARFGLTVLPDSLADFPGPLAGVLAGMEWLAAHQPQTGDLVTVPTDCPFLPRDLVARLLAARDAAGADLACAASLGRAHPVVGLWRAHQAPALRRAMVEDGMRRVESWAARYSRVEVAFEADPVDPFLNVNTPDDLFAAAAAYQPR